MSDQEFSKLLLDQKWAHIKQVMDYIVSMDRAYNLRSRYNTNHPEKDRKLEERNMRKDQYERWSHIKDLYATHRDELENTLEVQQYQECKSILERIFTLELDDALRDVIEE